MEYQLRCRIFGPAWGDFRPSSHSRDEFLALIRRTAEHELTPHLIQIVAPPARFSNCVVMAANRSQLDMWDDWVPGYQTKPEILDPSLHSNADAIRASLEHTTAASPGGTGHVTINLFRLIKTLLVSAGVTASNIQDDGRCTCCWQKDGQPVCWSLTRTKSLGGVDGRNFAVAWLEESGNS